MGLYRRTESAKNFAEPAAWLPTFPLWEAPYMEGAGQEGYKFSSS